MNTHNQPLADAYMRGLAAFREGVSIEINPFDDPNLAFEFRRGFKIARKHARFNATIAARKTA